MGDVVLKRKDVSSGDEEFQNRGTDQFNLSTTYGLQMSNDVFSWLHDKGVSTHTTDVEDRVDELKEELEKKRKLEVNILKTIAEGKAEGQPPHVLDQEFRALDWIWNGFNGMNWLENKIEELEEELDRQLAGPEDKDVENHIPFHWMCAKEFWDKILDFVIQNNRRIGREQAVRLWKKINEAKSTKSIGSWHFFMLGMECVRKLNMPGERDKLVRYADFAQKRAEAAGRVWGPKKKTQEEKSEEDAQREFERKLEFGSLDKVVWSRDDGRDNMTLKDFISDTRLSEDALIKAIDIRAGKARLPEEYDMLDKGWWK